MIDPEFTRHAMPSAMTTNAAERCRYPSKICRNRRTAKRNGELHRFCEEHRIKANLNQKRWMKSSQRKCPSENGKDRKLASPGAASPSTASSTSTHRREPQLQPQPASPQPLMDQCPTPPSFTALLHPLSYWEPTATATGYDQFAKEFMHDWSWCGPSVELVGRLEFDLHEHEIEPVMIQL